ncbi:MAG: c-type cytochrome [Gammaproteobacteria bacterium]
MLLTSVADARELLGSDDAIVNTGHTLFQNYCADCHGADARGGGVDTGFETARVKDLTRLAERNGGTLPFWELYEVISGSELLPAHGASRHMPIWGQALQETPALAGDNAQSVVRGRILAIMAYLATVQEP